MTSIKWRAISAIVLSGALTLVFWLVPGLEPSTFTSSPDGATYVFGALFAVFWLYLVVQGYALSHGPVGSAAMLNADNIISSIPALVALCAIFIRVVGFWPLSGFNMVIAVMSLLVAIYDLWVLGAAAAQISRRTLGIQDGASG
jgi:hypothetical protein